MALFLDQVRIVTCCKRCQHWTDQQEEVLITVTIPADSPTLKVFAVCRDTNACAQRADRLKEQQT